MTIKELIKLDFGIDLPIKGGNGNSIDNPVVIEYDKGINDYVYYMHTYVSCLCKGRNLIDWKIIKQSLINHKDRKIDQIKFTYVEYENRQKYIVTENYYFDITECFGVEPFS